MSDEHGEHAVFADDDVDPTIRGWLSQMAAASRALGGGADVSLAERRAIAERQREPWRTGGPTMAETRELTVAGMRARLHRPVAEGVLPVLVYLHGGGWTLFSIDTHDRLMREYAARAGVAVLGLDYPLAPEQPFPLALEAIAAALAWLADADAELALDGARFALGGDSAGANLAVSSALMLRDPGHAMPRALLLNYGAFDGTHRASFERYAHPDRYMLTPDEMDAFWRDYAGAAGRDDPLARPLLADLHGLPPTWFCVPRCDILLDENIAMAERMRAAGSAVELHVYEGATHSFLESAQVSPLAVRALDEASRWLADQLTA